MEASWQAQIEARAGWQRQTEILRGASRMLMPSGSGPAAPAAPAEPAIPLLDQHRLRHACGQLIERMLAANLAWAPQHVTGSARIEPVAAGGGGAIVVDLDEALHGVYAAVGYLVQALKGGSAGIEQQLEENAQLLAGGPLAWLEDTGMPHGVADFAVGAGVAVALLPLAILALKAGVEEMRAALSIKADLKAELGMLQTAIDSIDLITEAAGVGTRAGGAPADAMQLTDPLMRLLACLRGIDRQRCKALEFLQQQNRADFAIGLCSSGAGASILAKAAVDITTKSAFIATGGPASTLAAASATTAAGIAGIVGSLVLAPIAAASALGLGGYMVYKSRQKRDAFRREKNATAKRIDGVECAATESAALRDYGRFIVEKSAQHDRFYSSFAAWNGGFLAGSALYTSGVLGRVAVFGAVAAGVTVVAQPPVMLALLGLGIVGGLVMGAASQQFLVGHGRQHRYQQYYKDDDPELNRSFLASVELWGAHSEGADKAAGLRLRAALFQQISTREAQRQSFLEEVACQLGKPYQAKYAYTAEPACAEGSRGTDPTDPTDPQRARRGLKRSYARTVSAALRRAVATMRGRCLAACSFISKAMQGYRPGKCRAAAQRSWNQSRTHLTRTALAAWFAEPAHRGAQAELMNPMLDAQILYLGQKLKAKMAAYRGFEIDREGLSGNANHPLGGAASVECSDLAAVLSHPPSPDPRALALRKILLTLDRDLQFDQLRYVQAVQLRAELGAIALAPAAASRLGSPALAILIDRFVTLQNGAAYDPHAGGLPPSMAWARLANYLMKDAPRRCRDLRGKLLETELQATRLLDMARTG